MPRLVVQSDIDTYGAAIIADGQTPMQIGDIILFLSERNSFGNIFSSTAFPTARLGATYWLEGGPSSYNSIEIGSSTALTAPSDINNPNHIHFFNGQGLVDRVDAASLDVRELEINNFNYLVVDFETNTHPGLRDGWGSGRTNSFGFKAIQTYKERDAMALRVENSLNTMKSLEIRGAELTMGSFAKLRASSGLNFLDKFIIERCLFDRSMRGEGIYTGLTTAGPWPLHKNMIIRDNIFCCIAAEAIQLQQCGDGTRVYNNVVFLADTDYRTAFQADQDTAVQLDMSQGDLWMYNNIIYGFGKNGLQIFNKDMAGQGVSFGTAHTKIFNNLWSGTKAGLTARLHATADLNAKIIFRDNDVAEVLKIYGDVGPNRNYHYDMDGDAPVVFIGGRLPNDGQPEQNSTVDVASFNMTRATVPVPQFVNSGFDGMDINRITLWGEVYTVGFDSASNHSTSPTTINLDTMTLGGSISINLNTSSGGFAAGEYVKVFSRGDFLKFFYARVASYVGSTLNLELITYKSGAGTFTDYNVGKRIPYTTSDYCWLAEHQHTMEYNLYKCITDHSAHDDLRPDLAPGYWQLVWWDVNGKNMYDPLYNGIPYTTNFMEVAGDFRLVKGSEHHLLGRGLSCNEQRDDQTKMGWEWRQTTTGTIRDIPGAYEQNLTIERYSYLKPGRQVRYWVEKKTSTGAFQARIYSDWTTIA